MSHHDVIKAWKNPAYRNTLSPAEQAALPSNPDGNVELLDEPMGHFAGGVARNPPPHTALCRTQIACTVFEECSNLTCPTVICTFGCPTDLCTFANCGNPPIEPF